MVSFIEVFLWRDGAGYPTFCTPKHHPCLLPGCFKIRLCRRSLRQIEQHKFASITHSIELASGSSANRTIQTWRHVLSLKLDDLIVLLVSMVYLWVSLFGWLAAWVCWLLGSFQGKIWCCTYRFLYKSIVYSGRFVEATEPSSSSLEFAMTKQLLQSAVLGTVKCRCFFW